MTMLEKEVCIICYAINGLNTSAENINKRKKIAEENFPKIWCPTKFKQRLTLWMGENRGTMSNFNIIFNIVTAYCGREINIEDDIPYFCPYTNTHHLFKEMKKIKDFEYTIS